MAITNSIPNFKMLIDPSYVEKANGIQDQIRKTIVHPKCEVKIQTRDGKHTAEYVGTVAATETYVLGKQDTVCYDFGDHCVGYLSFDIDTPGVPSDAPALLRLKFGEKPLEIAEDSADYDGSLSSGWIQEEYIHVDLIPGHVELPRRYAFRYLEILVKDTSPNYKVTIRNVRCCAVSSGDIRNVAPLSIDDRELVTIDKISVKTMMECMQEVFEDGPKRDRRLWVGDLRLQALVNYKTFKNYELVKKCLYLFAGLRQNEGSVAACIYHKPRCVPSDIYLYDYSLLFVSCLYDYYTETKDAAVAEDLYAIARRQIEIASERIDSRGVVADSETWWCFIDWNDRLNKQAAAQATYIYALKQIRALALALGRGADIATFDQMLAIAVDGALTHLWDEKLGFFVSGEERQVSWASQIWFVLAEVFDHETNAALLRRLIDVNPDVEMNTPYIYHYYVQALILSDMQDEAVDCIKRYWGSMVEDGADCFYESYNPADKTTSPYGSKQIESYCHAWSGTPAYFIRHYLDRKDD